MEYLTGILGSHLNLTGILQIGLDVVILVLLAVLLLGKKRKISLKDAEVIRSLEKIIEETGAISNEFGANLEQRQELIREITARLDQRIQDARDVCTRLEYLSKTAEENIQALSAAKAAPSPAINRSSPARGDHQRVLSLANKGMDASEIAKSLNKPLGEVELILSLRKIAS